MNFLEMPNIKGVRNYFILMGVLYSPIQKDVWTSQCMRMNCTVQSHIIHEIRDLKLARTDFSEH